MIGFAREESVYKFSTKPQMLKFLEEYDCKSKELIEIRKLGKYWFVVIVEEK